MRPHLQALAIMATLGFQNMPQHESPVALAAPKERRRPPVRRVQTEASDEVKKWNAEVDARRAAKKANKKGRA